MALLGHHWVLGIEKEGHSVSGGISVKKGEQFCCELCQPYYGICIGCNRLLVDLREIKTSKKSTQGV